MTVTLYKYSGKAIVVDKTMPTGSGNVLAITADYGFEGNQDIDNIYINIEASTRPSWTYAYIDSFARYYFVTSIVWLSGNLWRLNLRCDVLKTFATEIKSQSGTILYSGSGDSRRYDPRLVYNLPPVKTKIDPALVNPNAYGDDVYMVMTVRYMEFWGPNATGFRAANQMQYIIFSPEAYFVFWARFMALSDDDRVAISSTICSLTMVRWLDLSGLTKTTYASFSSPEIYKRLNQDIQITCSTFNTTYPGPYDIWQIRADDYNGQRYLCFADSALSYADRKAQRLIDIPFVGQMNVDLDNLGLPSTTGFYLCCKIGYDFGGNQYVVIPGKGATSITDGSQATYMPEDYVTYPNNYAANFLTDESYDAEKETRNAQILSMLGTAASGIVSGIMTEGATIPATVASLGIGAANFALAEQKLEYQKAASMKLSGTSVGGSPYNTMPYYVVTPTPHIVKPAAALYKKTSASSTNATSFQTDYGKPDGEFRSLSTLTGFCQMGTVILTGFASATEPERNEIKNLLLSGVIL